MNARSLFVYPILVCICTSSRAEDSRRLLVQSSEACANLPAGATITLRREEGAWRVAALRLSADHVTDSDLERLGHLTTLDTLELIGTSRISAKGLRSVASLRALRRLALPGNLNESGLKVIASLRMLEDLDMSGSYGEERIRDDELVHLRGLRSLRRLSLAGLGLSDRSLEHIRSLKALEELNLSHNADITDAGVAQLSTLDNLRCLHLDKLGPTGLSALKDLTHLERLVVRVYVFSADRPAFSDLRSVKWLEVYGVADDNGRQVGLPENLRRLDVSLTSLDKLNLKSAPHLMHVGLDLGSPSARRQRLVDAHSLRALPRLTELTLVDVTDQDMSAVAGRKSLRSLSLESVCSATIGDSGLKALTGLHELESLRIANALNATDSGMDALGTLANLRRLELMNIPEVSVKGLTKIGQLKPLRALSLTPTYSGETTKEFVDSLVMRIQGMSELEELSLTHVEENLTDKAMSQLTTLKRLRVLDITGCSGYTDEALASVMTALPNLQVVKRSYRPAASQEKK